MDMNLKKLENDFEKKNTLISDLYHKIDIKDDLLKKKDSYIKNIHGNLIKLYINNFVLK